jgi:hypothetical protein
MQTSGNSSGASARDIVNSPNVAAWTTRSVDLVSSRRQGYVGLIGALSATEREDGPQCSFCVRERSARPAMSGRGHGAGTVSESNVVL